MCLSIGFFHWVPFCIYFRTTLYGRKVLWYEVFLPCNCWISTDYESRNQLPDGMLCFSIDHIGVCLRSWTVNLLQFTILGNSFIPEVSPITIYFFFKGNSTEFFVLTANNWTLILILASVCTAYAFTLRSKWCKTNSYSHVNTNLEPVYGIILAYFILGGKRMSFEFTLAH
jgi:hypothetical protein